MLDLNIFKERTKGLCKAKGISQKFVSESTGHGQFFLNDVWLEKRSVSGGDLHTIADILGTTPEYLSGETDDPSRGEVEMNKEDEELLALFKAMSPDNKALLKKLIEQMSGQ